MKPPWVGPEPLRTAAALHNSLRDNGALRQPALTSMPTPSSFTMRGWLARRSKCISCHTRPECISAPSSMTCAERQGQQVAVVL